MALEPCTSPFCFPLSTQAPCATVCFSDAPSSAPFPLAPLSAPFLLLYRTGKSH